MMASCASNNLNVAKWLYEIGAAEDIRTKDAHTNTPLFWSSFKNCHSTVLWLVLEGATNGNGEEGSPVAILTRDIQANWKETRRAALRQNLSALLDQHLIFTELVLPAVSTARATSAEASSSSHCRGRKNMPPAHPFRINYLYCLIISKFEICAELP